MPAKLEGKMAQTDEPRAVPDPDLTGIGGWLILPLIQLIFTPLYLIWLLVQRLPEVAARVPAHAQGAQIAVVLFTLPFFAALIFCLVRFLQKRRSVPWLMTLFYGLNIAGLVLILAHLFKGVGFTDEIADQSLAAWRGVRAVIEIAVSVLWIFYFHNSVRVTNTFTTVRPSREKQRDPKGLGGWLVLPLAAVVFIMVFMLIGMVKTGLAKSMIFAFQHGHWLVLLRQAFFGALALGGSIACLVYALWQKRIARWLLAGYFAIWTVVIAVTLAQEPVPNRAGLVSGVLILAIVAYLLLSRRVKNTFIN
jgi:hypothetical protein